MKLPTFFIKENIIDKHRSSQKACTQFSKLRQMVSILKIYFKKPKSKQRELKEMQVRTTLQNHV